MLSDLKGTDAWLYSSATKSRYLRVNEELLTSMSGQQEETAVYTYPIGVVTVQDKWGYTQIKSIPSQNLPIFTQDTSSIWTSTLVAYAYYFIMI